MKHLSIVIKLVLLTALIFFYGRLMAQQPFERVTDLLGDQEIVLIWNEPDGSPGADMMVHQQILDPAAVGVDAKVKHSTNIGQLIGSNTAGYRQVAVATGDFNGDNFEDYVAGYVNPDGSIDLYIPSISLPTFDNTSGTTFSTGDTVAVGGSGENGKARGIIKLACGDLDGDDEDEIVLAFRKDSDGHLWVNIYETNGTLTPTLDQSFDAGSLSVTSWLESFWVTVDDFDIDGNSEILLGRAEPNGTSADVTVELYAYPGMALLDDWMFNRDTDASSPVHIALTTGDFNRNTRPDIAVCLTWSGTTSEDDLWVYTAWYDDEADTIIPSGFSYGAGYHQNGDVNLDAQTGNLNGNSRDELVVGTYGSFKVFSFGDDLSITPEVGKSGPAADHYGNSNNRLAVHDTDRDGLDNIVMVGNLQQDNNPDWDQTLYFRVWEVSTDLNTATQIGSRSHEYISTSGTGAQMGRHYAMAMGDFDMDRIRLGAPNVYQRTDILQPLVILNAPPVHFDVLNSTPYDVSKCYNGNSCDHTSTYTQVQSTDMTASTKISNDWAVSASLSAGGTFAGVGAKAKLEAKYGQKFENTTETGTTAEVEISVTAADDDQIYATVCDYTMYEYPTYVEDTFAGYVLFVRPKLTENRWFPSKSWSGYRYIPDHEVGNMLSYREYGATTDNPAVEEQIKDFGTAITVSSAGTQSWGLAFSEFTSNGWTQEKNASLEISSEISKWGIELGASASYSHTSVSTHTTKVENQLSLDVSFGNADLSIGEVAYVVRPYAYWATNGALVLDYDARPELPAGGGTPTWWSDNYAGEQDLAFILPWRLDPEKGYTLQDQAKRGQTKSITFSPGDPDVGDTVKITAWIHNFSFQDNTTASKISFYIGHPNQGGTIITDILGETQKTIAPVDARSREKVEFEFVMPSGLTFPRIYGFIDPDDNLTEIHEDNNVGFNILGDYGVPTAFEQAVQQKIELATVYPNPATDIIHIDYAIPESADVVVRLLDISGKTVALIDEGSQTRGVHFASVDMRDLGTGIYMLSIEMGTYSEVHKVVVAK